MLYAFLPYLTDLQGGDRKAKLVVQTSISTVLSLLVSRMKRVIGSIQVDDEVVDSGEFIFALTILLQEFIPNKYIFETGMLETLCSVVRIYTFIN